MKDPLDLLLADAKKANAKAKIQRAAQKKLEPQGSIYDAEYWTPGRTIRLHHRQSDGSVSFLGLFTEMLHPRMKCRRLLPKEVQHENFQFELAGSFYEEVEGDWWIHAQLPVQRTETLREIQEITARFHELIAEA